MEKNLSISLPRLRASAVLYCFAALSLVLAMRLGMTGLGPLDDHHLVRTLFQGHDCIVYADPELGRFIPLTAQEYCLAAWFFEPSSPLLFHVIGAIKVLFAGLLLFYCLVLTRASSLVIVVLWSIVVFSVGFSNAAFRLQVGELNALVLILIFILAILVLENKTSIKSYGRRISATVGLIAISTAFFYKELIFVFALAFAISELARKHRQSSGEIPRHLWVLLAMGACYVSAYAWWRAVYVTGSYSDFHAMSLWDVGRHYAENDPFIVFLVLPVVIYRFIAILRDEKKYELSDSFLVAAISYFFAYLALGMFNTYYLLPAYGFAACGLAGLAATTMTRYVKPLILIFSTLFAVNNATAAYSDIRTLELTANNHWRFVLFLTGWMAGNPGPELGKRNLVLVGVSPASGVEIVHSLKTFLTSLGASEASFTVKATEPVDNNAISNFYGMGEKDVQKPQPGDLLIFNPYQKVFTLPTLQSNLYGEIYRSDISWAPPRWKAWTWTRFCLLGRADCSVNVANHRRYAGYAVLLQTRDTGAVTDMRSPNRTGLN